MFWLALTLPLLVKAQNPIIRDQFTADPTARIFNDKVYLYPSHDIIPPEGQRQDWFAMEDYHVFSSENLTEWTDHGVIVSQNNVTWVKPNDYSMWAPDCVYKNGKYYFYFPSVSAKANTFNVGVAISDSPEGPFVPEPEPIKGVNGIDPCVLQASDGNAYLFYGRGYCAKLNPNMKELADDNPVTTINIGNFKMNFIGYDLLRDLPNNQAEGPFAFEYNDNFYLTYPYVRNDTEVLAYAMSKNVLGPYEYKGIIMAEHENGCWTNHHSIINYKGQWYLFYHHNAFSPNDDKRRSVQIEKLFFNPDGTIQEVKKTMRGVGINQATETIEIDRYSSASSDVTNGLIEKENAFPGLQATLPTKDSWLKYTDVDFSSIEDGHMIMNVKADDDVKFCIREGSTKGKAIACITLSLSSSSADMRGQWVKASAALEYVPEGVIDLVMTNEGEHAVSVDWVTFKNSEISEIESEVEEVSANVEEEEEDNDSDSEDEI